MCVLVVVFIAGDEGVDSYKVRGVYYTVVSNIYAYMGDSLLGSVSGRGAEEYEVSSLEIINAGCVSVQRQRQRHFLSTADHL